jgi:bifunctional DNase/RNase
MDDNISCDVASCQSEPVLLFSKTEKRRLQFEKFFCEHHAHRFFDNLLVNVPVGIGTAASLDGAVAVDLEFLAYYKHDINRPACIYLHEIGGRRRICFTIDQYAWSAIVAYARDRTVVPPLTHSAWAESLRLLDADLRDVLLDRKSVADEWWSAKLNLTHCRGITSFNVRPTDAILLAMNYNAPIFVAEEAISAFALRETG